MARVSIEGHKGAQRALPALDDIAPELATLVARAPGDDGWLYETKYDGYRILARVQNGQVALATRNGNDFTARAPKVVQALATLADGLVLDGELVSPPRGADGHAPSACLSARAAGPRSQGRAVGRAAAGRRGLVQRAHQRWPPPAPLVSRIA